MLIYLCLFTNYYLSLPNIFKLLSIYICLIIFLLIIFITNLKCKKEIKVKIINLRFILNKKKES